MTEPTISEFSIRFAQVLKGVMREHGVTQDEVARRLGKSKGFVSEHVSGKKAPDTDLIDAIAHLAGESSRELVAEVARRMRGEARQTPVSRIADRRRSASEDVDPYAVQGEAAREDES